MKIFITGSNGFTGKYLKKILINQGHSVFCGSSHSSCGHNEYHFNLLDIQSMKNTFQRLGRIDCFIHLAATSFALANDQDIELNNKIGVQNLMQILYDFPPNYSIFSSSASVYGNASGLLSENTPLNPITKYAKSKLFLEQQVIDSGLNSIIVRPFNYTGIFQSDSFLIPKLIKSFKEKKEFIHLGNLNLKREFNDVRDVVRIYSDLISRTDLFSKNCSIFNIGSGKSYYISYIVDLLCDISGQKINVIQDESLMRSNESKDLCCDTSSLINAGIKPCSGDISSLLKNMLNS